MRVRATRRANSSTFGRVVSLRFPRSARRGSSSLAAHARHGASGNAGRRAQRARIPAAARRSASHHRADQRIALAGALQIKIGEETIGAIGVSGAPGGDKDEACAKAGIDKVADQLK